MVRLVRIQDISKDYIVVLLIEVDQRIDKESSVEKWKRMKLLYVELRREETILTPDWKD